MLSYVEFYKEKLENQLNDFLKDRKKIIMDMLIYGGIILSIIILNSVIIYFFPNEIIAWGYVGELIAAAIFAYIILRRRGKFISKYQELVSNSFVKSIDKNLEVDLSASLEVDDFFESQIFKRTDLTDFFGAYLIHGKYKNTELRFSRVNAYYEKVKNVTQRTNNGEYVEVKQKQIVKKVPLFKGFLFVADFNKDFKHKTILKSKEKITKFSSTDKISFFKGKTIKMENNDFNSKFEVFSDDEIESRYILSLNLMEKILKIQDDFKNKIQIKENLGFISKIRNSLSKKFSKSIEISFVGSEIYIFIPNNDTFLNFSLFLKKRNEFETKKFYETFSKIIKIVDDLDLTTRIWTKN